MGLLDRYLASLKPLSVEEPIDVVWHRLAGYLIARLSFPTPISADAITIFAIFIGIGSGASIVATFPHHMAVAGALLTISAMFDCADGQLARMRKKSSNLGRMLDGFSDMIVMGATFIGAVIHFWQIGAPLWVYPLSVIAAPTCTFHFGWYDHYKNTYLRMTEPTFREGEDVERALVRHKLELERNPPGLAMRFVWWVYIRYVTGQAWLLKWSDPHTTVRIDLLPPYDAKSAAIYARHALGPMRAWRTFFGLGTHVFTMSIACALDRFELYVLWRVVVLNVLAFAVILPWQRAASKRAFEELGFDAGHAADAFDASERAKESAKRSGETA